MNATATVLFQYTNSVVTKACLYFLATIDTFFHGLLTERDKLIWQFSKRFNSQQNFIANIVHFI
jgi:hypothetical protein